MKFCFMAMKIFKRVCSFLCANHKAQKAHSLSPYRTFGLSTRGTEPLYYQRTFGIHAAFQSNYQILRGAGYGKNKLLTLKGHKESTRSIYIVMKSDCTISNPYYSGPFTPIPPFPIKPSIAIFIQTQMSNRTEKSKMRTNLEAVLVIS